MSSLTALVFYAGLICLTLILAKQRTWRKTFTFLGLTTKKEKYSHLAVSSILLFVGLFAVLTLEALILSAFQVDDVEKVSAVISTFSIYAILIAGTIGPFAEELFFRGYLQKYTGVIVSSLLFALLHYSFGSVVEVIGAFTASMMLGYWVKYRGGNLWPVILAHAGYNLVSIFIVMVAV